MYVPSWFIVFVLGLGALAFVLEPLLIVAAKVLSVAAKGLSEVVDIVEREAAKSERERDYRARLAAAATERRRRRGREPVSKSWKVLGAVVVITVIVDLIIFARGG